MEQLKTTSNENTEIQKKKSQSEEYADAVLFGLRCEDIEDPIERQEALQDWGRLTAVTEDLNQSSGKDRDIKIEGLNLIISAPDVEPDIKADIITYIGIAGNTLELEPGIAALEASGVTDAGLQAQLEFYHFTKPAINLVSSGEPQSSP